jgi:hypothetical protein
VFLSLVDPKEAPYSGPIRQLAVNVLVTNRDLPLLMPVGSATDFSMAISAPVEGIRCLRGPSRPRPAILEGEVTWRLINHLSLNYLTVTDLDQTQGASALRELLELYADLADGDVVEFDGEAGGIVAGSGKLAAGAEPRQRLAEQRRVGVEVVRGNLRGQPQRVYLRTVVCLCVPRRYALPSS